MKLNIKIKIKLTKRKKPDIGRVFNLLSTSEQAGGELQSNNFKIRDKLLCTYKK